MSKYQIPEGGFAAVDEAISKARGTKRDLTGGQIRDITLEAFIGWQSENSLKPSQKVIDEIYDYLPGCGPETFADQWVRRMWLAPESEMIGEETLNAFCSRYQKIGDAVIEAYRRGQQSKERA